MFGYTARFGFVTSNDVLKRWQGEIHVERDRKLEHACQQRQLLRGQADGIGWNPYGSESAVQQGVPRPEPKEYFQQSRLTALITQEDNGTRL
jgi:hypothetical protein